MFEGNEDLSKAVGKISRRSILRLTALAAAAPALAQLANTPAAHADEVDSPDPDELIEATIADLQGRMATGELTSRELTRAYIRRIERIDQHGPHLNSVLKVNPDALAIAEALDRERQRQGPRGPLHGIPILLKDNIDTADQLQTTAGSLALLNIPVRQDSTTAQRLRQAGAVILGKTNLSEASVGRRYDRQRSPAGVNSAARSPRGARLVASPLLPRQRWPGPGRVERDLLARGRWHIRPFPC